MTTEQEITQFIRKLESAVTAFEKKDRKAILTRGAAIARKELRISTKVGKPRKKANGEISTTHTRYKGGKEYTYHIGNLRRSMKTLTKLKRSQDVFVGPELGGRAGVYEYGKPGQPVDGYYYAMAYGNGANYQSQLIQPVLSRSKSAIIEQMGREFIKRFGTRAAQQQLDVQR
jgi:hypothetical protein